MHSTVQTPLKLEYQAVLRHLMWVLEPSQFLTSMVLALNG